TPWCDEFGKVIDDGTVHRLADDQVRWTAAHPQWRWLHLNSAGLQVESEDESEATAALALQGPFSRDVLAKATGESWDDLRYFRRRPTTFKVGRCKVEVDVSRTGYTGDLGYELWIPAAHASDVWDQLMDAGKAWGMRPAGVLALDVQGAEARCIRVDVHYER